MFLKPNQEIIIVGNQSCVFIILNGMFFLKLCNSIKVSAAGKGSVLMFTYVVLRVKIEYYSFLCLKMLLYIY